MSKQLLKNGSFSDRIYHQAICTKCSYAGTRRDTKIEAEDDADEHMGKPGNLNHIVKIVTVELIVKDFAKKRHKRLASGRNE